MKQEYELKKNPFSKQHIFLLFLLILITSCAKIYWSQKPLFLKSAGVRTVHSIVITRDLERRNFDIFNTEVYYNGKTAKYVQAFPAYKVIVGLLYKVFGEHEKFGRYVSITAISVALYLLFHLLLYYLTAPCVLFALTLFSFNHLTLYHTYMFQPTSFEIMLLVITMYLLHKYFENPGQRKFYWLWLASVLLTMLVKITYLVYMLPILYLFYNRYGKLFFLKKDFIVFSILFLSICGSWYFYCLIVTEPAFQETFISYFKDPLLWLKDNPKILLGYYNETFKSVITLLTIPGIIFALIGLFFVIRNKKQHFLLFSFLSGFVMLLLIPHKFRVHPYNYINFLIWVSALLAFGIYKAFDNKRFTKDFRKAAFPVIASIFMISFILNGYLYFRINNDKDRAFIEPLCKRIKENTPEEARIAFYGDSIRDMWTQECSYASERKGWAVRLDYCSDKSIKHYIRLGATHVAVLPPESRSAISQQKQKNTTKKTSDFDFLFAKFTLSDSIYKDYMLFNVYPLNNNELIRKEGMRTSIQFGDEIKLEKIILKEVNKGLKIKFLWRSLKKRIEAKYILIGLNFKTNRIFDHRLFNKSFPTNRWRPNKLYAEEINISPNQKVFSGKCDTEFLLVLYDPVKNKLLNPSPNSKGEIPIIKVVCSKDHATLLCKWISERGNSAYLKDLRKYLNQAVDEFLQGEKLKYAFIRDRYQFR